MDKPSAIETINTVRFPIGSNQKVQNNLVFTVSCSAFSNELDILKPRGNHSSVEAEILKEWKGHETKAVPVVESQEVEPQPLKKKLLRFLTK